jgi:hypothetical protein
MFSDKFLPGRFGVLILCEAADDVISVGLDSLIVKSKRSDKDCELKHEIASDTNSRNQTEIL